MSWAKLDDQYADHPKIVQVGPLGMALHVAMICYCARFLTDGFVPAGIAARLISLDGIFIIDSNGVSNGVTHKQLTNELTKVGLLDAVNGGYMVHDYLLYNPPAEQVKAERAANAARQAAYKEKKAANGVSNGVSNGVNNKAPSPSPSILNTLGLTPESEPEQEKSMKKFNDPLWDLMHGQDVQEPARQGVDLDWVPADIQDMARAFITSSNLPVPSKKERGFWVNSLRAMRMKGLCVTDIIGAVEKMRGDGLTIKSPSSVEAVAVNSKAAGGGQNSRINHPLPSGI